MSHELSPITLVKRFSPSVAVYKNAEWSEYIVVANPKAYRDGLGAHCDDKQEAYDTARHILNNGELA